MLLLINNYLHNFIQVSSASNQMFTEYDYTDVHKLIYNYIYVCMCNIFILLLKTCNF